MVDGRVVHVTTIGSHNLESQKFLVEHSNWRPFGALRWKVEDHRLGRAGSVMWKVGTSKVLAHVCVG
jgi:hypothetical protein